MSKKISGIQDRIACIQLQFSFILFEIASIIILDFLLLVQKFCNEVAYAVHYRRLWNDTFYGRTIGNLLFSPLLGSKNS